MRQIYKRRTGPYLKNYKQQKKKKKKKKKKGGKKRGQIYEKWSRFIRNASSLAAGLWDLRLRAL